MAGLRAVLGFCLLLLGGGLAWAQDDGYASEPLEPPGLAASAASYRNTILAKRPPQPAPKAADAAVAAANDDEAAQRFDAAIADVERAVQQGYDNAPTWLRLSRLWLARTPPDADRAVQAAWLAYEAGGADEDRNAALLAVADITDQRLGRSSEALALLRRVKAQGLTPEGLDARIGELTPKVGLEWRKVRVDAESDDPRVCLDFTANLAERPGMRFEDYVAVEPRVTLDAEASESSLCLTGFAHASRYQLTVREGLPGTGGLTLKKGETREVTIPDRAPSVAFRGSGFILPRLGPQGVPVTTVNLDAVLLQVYRFNDRNLVSDIARRFPEALDQWSGEQVRDQQGEEIWHGRMAVRNGRNAPVVTAIPVGQLTGELKPGLYAILAIPADRPESELSYTRATQWLVVSDLALGTMRGADGIDVVARSLTTAKPLADAEITLVARNNAELARLRSDADGRVHFDRALAHGTGGNEPILVLGYGAAGDFAVLDLVRPALDLADRGIGGRQAPGPLDAFLYTDRGVYRPGERVNVTALLRDDRANAVEGVPLTLKVLRPNGTVVRASVVAPAAPGLHVLPIDISKAAPLGTWTIEAYADPKAPPIGSVQLQVEEFVPERLAVEARAAVPVLEPGKPADVEVSARFLYGPPASGLDGTAEVSLAPDPAPYPAYPGYAFGLAQEEVTPRTQEQELPTTDAAGRSMLSVSLPPMPDTTRPLRAEIRVAVAEPGGRPSRAEIQVPVRAQALAIGLRPKFQGGQIDEGGEAGFDVVVLGPDGAPMARPGLKVELFAERAIYQWYRQNDAYNYRTITRSESLRRGTLDVAVDAPASTSFSPLEYGRYRLEVSDPAAGVATSVRFAAGWQVSEGAVDRPDKVEVNADKAAYLPGETVRLRVEAPFAGEMQVAVATDRVLDLRQMALPKEGAAVEIPVRPEWGAGAYVLVTALRPPVAGREHLPTRALGVVWLPIDAKPRTLQVALPDLGTVRPRGHVELPIRVTGADGAPAAGAWVTLAAVDEGILRLTDFASPDPAGFYFAKRALGLDLRDDYGRLITGLAGPFGEPRQGGDQGGLGAALPEVPLTIVSLFQGPLVTDADGMVRVSLELPNFNGELRLMAVAGDATRLGSAASPLTVRDPLVADLILPRFLAPGDEATITASVHNVEAEAGSYKVTIEGAGAVGVENGTSEVALAHDARTSVTATLNGLQAGSGRVRLGVTGPGGFTVSHELPITVRPPRPVETLFTRRELPMGGSSTADQGTLAPYVPGTAAVRLGYSTTPPFDLAGTLAALDRYPYGCLEQLISRGMPLLVAGALDDALARQRENDVALDARVDAAVAQVLDKQRYDGAFGLWSGYGDEQPWLTAYAAEFLTRAKAKGRAVPDAPYLAALDWLKAHALDGGTEPGDLASRAYAVHVLALAGVATPGIARYLSDSFLDQLPTPLAKGQLAAALARLGDLDRARTAAAAATASLTRDFWYSDYGSTVRDAAALVTVLGETGLLADHLPALLDRLPVGQLDVSSTNTQEQAWLVLAGSTLLAGGDALPKLQVTGAAAASTLPFFIAPTAGELAQGIKVANLGPGQVWEAVTLSGVPKDPRPAAREGLAIRRHFYTRTGEPLDFAALHQNDVFVVELEGAATTGIDHRVLVSHGLPAGWEIENPKLGGDDAAGLGWLGDLSEPVAVEARDDRFTAALDLTADAPSFKLAFLARAVTAGAFELPGASVEDMYRPRIFARQAAGRISVLPH